MAVDVNDVQFHLSGGAANTDPNLSFGGARSTAGANRVIGQTSAAATMTGVTVDFVVGNQEGQGLLTYVFSSNALLWRSFGTTQSVGKTIVGDGQYVLGSSTGYMVVTVVDANLPGSDDTEFLQITNSANNVWDDVSPGESLTGLIEYRCHYVINTHGTDTAYGVRLWVDSQPTSGTLTLDMALDVAGLNGTAATIIDEEDSTNQVSGLSYTAPVDYTTGIDIGDMAAGAFHAVWIRRTVPVGNRSKAEPDNARIVLSAFTAP